MDVVILEILSFARCLKKWRDSRSQQEAADGLGLAKGFYQRLETGKSVPSLDTLVKFKNISGYSWAYIFGESEDPTGHTLGLKLDDLYGTEVVVLKAIDYKNIHFLMDNFKKADERDQEIVLSILAKYKDAPDITERQKKLNDLGERMQHYLDNHATTQLPTAKRKTK